MKYKRFKIFQTYPKSLLMNYKIIIFLLLFNLNFEKNTRILQNNEYKIQLVIQGNGEQNLLSDSFSDLPQKVLVNGDESRCSNRCNLTEEKNNITLIFYSELSICKNMFNGLENILEVDLSNIDISCRNMDYMFNNCTNLEKITFGNINNKIDSIKSIFYGCSNLLSLNLSNFVFSEITEMSQMFYGCSSLKYLNLYSYSVTSNNYNTNNSPIESIFENISTNVVYCINNERTKNNLLAILNIWNYTHESTLNNDYNYCYESCNNNLYQYDNICFKRCPSGTLLDNYFCRDNKCKNNNDTNEECKYEQPREYYFDSYDNLYKKCFNSCDLCFGEGNITNNNCIKCKPNYAFFNESEFINDTNCYEICNYYYYFDESNIYHCTIDNLCPEEYNKLMISKNKCVKKCENNNNDDDKSNVCYEFDINEINNNTEMLNKIKENILSSYDVEKSNILIMKGLDNIIFELTTNKNDLKLLQNQALAYNFNLSIIDLDKCESLLKQRYNLNEEDSLIFLKQENLTTKASEKNVQFEVYDKDKKKLNLSYCSESDINLYVKLEFSQEMKNISDKIKELGYNMFDTNDKFYNDICAVYKSARKTDVLLSDRLDYIYNNDDVQCQSNCGFSNYYFESEYINCKCKVNENNDFVYVKTEKFKPKKIYEMFYDTLKNSNYEVLKCYKLVFVKTVITKNIGSIIVISFFLIHLICLFIYIFKGIKPLYKTLGKKMEHLNTIEKIGDQIINSETLELNKKSRNSISKKKLKLKNPPIKNNKKNLAPKTIYKINNKNNSNLIINKSQKPNNTRIIRQNKNNNFRFRKLNSNSLNICQKNSKIIKINNKNVNSNTKLKNKVSINSKNKNNKENNQKKNLDEYQMVELDYKSALKYDKRSFWKTYITYIKREHSFIFTFFVYSDLNLPYIKVSRFIFLLASDMAMNVFFFSDESMHKLFISYGEYDFVQQIPQILYSTIVSQILEIFLCYLSLTDKHIYQLKEIDEITENRKKVLFILRCIKIKLVGFYIFTIIFFGIFWYTVSAFCAVYENTQIPFIKDSVFSLLLSIIIPFFMYFFPTSFRRCALKSKKRNLECLYKFSEIIPFF